MGINMRMRQYVRGIAVRRINVAAIDLLFERLGLWPGHYNLAIPSFGEERANLTEINASRIIGLGIFLVR